MSVQKVSKMRRQMTKCVWTSMSVPTLRLFVNMDVPTRGADTDAIVIEDIGYIIIIGEF